MTTPSEQVSRRRMLARASNDVSSFSTDPIFEYADSRMRALGVDPAALDRYNLPDGDPLKRRRLDEVSEDVDLLEAEAELVDETFVEVQAELNRFAGERLVPDAILAAANNKFLRVNSAGTAITWDTLDPSNLPTEWVAASLPVSFTSGERYDVQIQFERAIAAFGTAVTVTTVHGSVINSAAVNAADETVLDVDITLHGGTGAEVLNITIPGNQLTVEWPISGIVAPLTFAGFFGNMGAPTSQSFSYSAGTALAAEGSQTLQTAAAMDYRLVARFSERIYGVGISGTADPLITTSSGITIANADVTVINGDVVFKYIAGTNASETFTFHHIRGEHTFASAAVLATSSFPLVAPPPESSVIWALNEPLENNTFYNNVQITVGSPTQAIAEVQFISSTLANALNKPQNIRLSGDLKAVVFDVQTPADATATYTLYGIKLASGARISSAALETGLGNVPVGLAAGSLTPATWGVVYNPVLIQFVRPVTSITSVTSFRGATVVLNPVSGGHVSISYTPATGFATDTLTFVGVTDAVEGTNTGPVTFLLSGLLAPAPTISGWSGTNPSAVSSYTGLQVNFSTPIASIGSITGTGITGVGGITYGPGNLVTFNATVTQSSPTFLFNNVGAVNGGVAAQLSLGTLPTATFATAPIQQSRVYTGLVINLTAPAAGAVTMVSQSGSISTTSGAGAGTTAVTVNYTTPSAASDVITISGAVSGQTIQLAVQGLIGESVFSSLTETPTSQNFSYTALEANFSKVITAISGITPTGGGTISNVSVVAGKVRFDYATPASSSVTLTFNGLVASDGTIDTGAPESVTFSLAAAPTITGWSGTIPSTVGTFTGVQALFSTPIASVGSITGTGVSGVGSVTYGPGNAVVFNVTVTQNSPTYLFNDVVAVNGGRVVGPLSLATMAVPTGFVVAPITQSLAYVGLEMNFSRAVQTPAPTISTSAGGVVSNISIVSGRVRFDYTTPAAASEVLTFTSVRDSLGVTNVAPVTFNLTGLLPGPTFSSLTETPTSQNFSYTALEANFSKVITACSGITPTGGGVISNVSVVAGKVRFDYFTPSSSSVTLTFNGLAASDGTIDTGALESVTFSLAAVPTTPSWFANQPVLGSTTYTGAEVAFNKSIASVGSVTAPGATISNVTIASGRVRFDVVTPANPAITYTLSDVRAVDGGRVASATLTTGPTVTAILSNNNAAVGNKVLIQAASQTYAVTFSKTISNQPTATLPTGTATYVSGSGTATITYSLSNVASTTIAIFFGTVSASDGTSSADLALVLQPVAAQTLNRIAEQTDKATPRTSYVFSTAYNLAAIFNKQISANISGVTVTASTGTQPTGLAFGSVNDYHFSWTTGAISTVTLSFNNVRDVDGFVYSTPFTQVIAITDTPAHVAMNSFTAIRPASDVHHNLVTATIALNSAQFTTTGTQATMTTGTKVYFPRQSAGEGTIVSELSSGHANFQARSFTPQFTGTLRAQGQVTRSGTVYTNMDTYCGGTYLSSNGGGVMLARKVDYEANNLTRGNTQIRFWENGNNATQIANRVLDYYFDVVKDTDYVLIVSFPALIYTTFGNTFGTWQWNLNQRSTMFLEGSNLAFAPVSTGYAQFTPATLADQPWTAQFWYRARNTVSAASTFFILGADIHIYANGEVYLQANGNFAKISDFKHQWARFDDTPRRITVTRNGTTFRVYDQGNPTNVAATTGVSYSFDSGIRTARGYGPSVPYIPDNGWLAGLTIFMEVRTDVQIASDDRTDPNGKLLCHYHLDGNLNNSYGTNGAGTALGSVTYQRKLADPFLLTPQFNIDASVSANIATSGGFVTSVTATGAATLASTSVNASSITYGTLTQGGRLYMNATAAASLSFSSLASYAFTGPFTIVLFVDNNGSNNGYINSAFSSGAVLDARNNGAKSILHVQTPSNVTTTTIDDQNGGSVTHVLLAWTRDGSDNVAVYTNGNLAAPSPGVKSGTLNSMLFFQFVQNMRVYEAQIYNQALAPLVQQDLLAALRTKWLL